MISKRLKTIASLVPTDSYVVDVGCDHAYLPIYLAENNIAKHVYACDISKNALDNALSNVLQSNCKNKISLILSDGLESISDDYNVVVISGMGTNTIKHILREKANIPNVILSSNNYHYELRLFMQELGYIIKDEKFIQEKGKYYPIILYQPGTEKLSTEELYFGKKPDINYLKYLRKKYKAIIDQLPLNSKNKITKTYNILETLLKKNGQ